ncbi:molybdopterin-dependent oxidoreductase [Halomonas sp.]|uniref:molybdopterin-dependent oxidoreductase n=1 Tax=Halomonas sp. TaxID=1486246 RepID=UPI003566E3C0
MTLDRQSLLTLPQASMETRVPWHDQPAKFEGPLLNTLVKHLGVRGETLVITGLDGYSTRISLDESTAMNAMLAHRCNGKALGIRDLGPLLLLLPEGYGLSTQQRLFRTVWQVTHIVVE